MTLLALGAVVPRALASCPVDGWAAHGAAESGGATGHVFAHDHVIHLVTAGTNDHTNDDRSGHHHHHHGKGTVSAQGLPFSDGEGHDHACCHVHVSCCVTPALAAGEVRISHPAVAREKLTGLAAALPLGSLTSPLLRPPRARV